MERFIVFDVETPNYKNDRMSAIGVAVVENGELVSEYETLIDPETFFSPFNIQLTGITPEAAAEAPTFPQIWQELQPVFESGILAAHNAPFDMGVLRSCLAHYGIRWRKYAPYICTCQMARRCYGLPRNNLNVLCDHLGIALDHHRAGSDSRAAALLLMDELARGMEPGDFKRFYYMLPKTEEVR